MTVIFLCKNRVYTDSAHYKDKERFISLSKIHPLKEPMKVFWQPQLVRDIPELAWNYYLKDSPAFEDTIHGWTGTGDNPMLDAAIKQLLHLNGSIHALWRALYTADRMKLLIHENSYTLVLFGEKADYAISTESSIDVRIHPRNDPAAFGSGATAVIRHYMMQGQDPVRALYNCFIDEATCGGMIDCWHFPTVDVPELYREAIGSEYTGDALFQLLQQEGPLALDFIQHKSSVALGDAMYALGALSTCKDAETLAKKGWIHPKTPSRIKNLTKAAHKKRKTP